MHAAGVRHTAPATFDAKVDADAWLRGQRQDKADGIWSPPKKPTKPDTFESFATDWLATRKLAPINRQNHQRLLDKRILPALGKPRLHSITPIMVRSPFDPPRKIR